MSTFLKSANFNGRNGTHFELILEYDVLSQSISANTSNVRFYLKMKSKDGYSASGSISNGYINNHNVGSFYSIGVNSTIDIGYWDENNVPHNSDGTRNLTFSASINTPWDIGSASVNGSFDLPKINRIAITNNVTGDNIEGNFSVNYTKYITEYTYKLRISVPNVIMLERIDYNTSGTTFTLSNETIQELYSRIGISNSINLGFAVETYSGTTKLSDGNEVIITGILTNADPIFSNFTFADTNSTTLALTGNSQYNINNYSNITATISTSNKAIAQKGATMSKYRFNCGTNAPVEANYSDSSNVTLLMNNASTGAFNVYAIDNRNNSTLVTKFATQEIQYEPIYLDKQNCSIQRDNNQIGQNAILTLNGTIWNNSFGQVTNSIKSVVYQFKKTDSSTWITGTTTITPTTSGNTFTFSNNIASDNLDTTWDLDASYNIRVTISDELTSDTAEFILANANPTISLDKKGVGIMCAFDSSLGGSLQVNGRPIDIEKYSSSETVVGKWTDDKPIYRKTINIGTLPNSTLLQVAHNISIDTPISCNLIVIHKTNVNQKFTSPMTNGATIVSSWVDKTNICVYCSTNRSDYEGTATIEYTKTTD